MEQDVRMTIARLAADEIPEDAVVNLGAGIPTLVARFLTGRRVHFHTENGMIGFGPPPPPGEEDWDLVDAAKQPVTEQPGCAFFHSGDSFSMIRGGHVDISVMGALQVDEEGTLANWRVPGARQLGMGGAMDLAAGAKRLIIACQIVSPDGKPKLVPKCTLPITAFRCVDTVVTELGVFRVRQGAMVLTKLAEGATLDGIRQKVSARLEVAPELKAELL